MGSMNYQQHVAALGRDAVEGIEEAVALAVRNLHTERAVRALCEVLVDMMACSIVRAAHNGVEFDVWELTSSFAKQLHMLVPRMIDLPLQNIGEAPNRSGTRWNLMPLSPRRLGKPLTLEESLIVQEIVEQIDRCLNGHNLTVGAELCGRLVGNICKNAQISSIATELILEDVLGRAFESLTSWDEAQQRTDEFYATKRVS